MFLGFVLASASLLGAGTQKSPTLIAIVVPLLALGLPILDMLMTIARRFLDRRSIFAADRGHIHHRLLDMGLTHRRSVLSLYLVSVAFTIVALIAYLGRSWQIGFALFALTAVLVGIVRFVGYFSTIVNVSQVGQDDLEPLRRSVPRVLRRMAAAGSLEQLPVLLGEFGAESGLLAVRIVNPKNQRLKRWGWESPRTQTEPAKEAVCASFLVSDGPDRLQVEFFFENASGRVNPQVQILLQLVADGAEALIALPREKVRAPAPSHSERIAHGSK
jgi:UDP-GlcNAc:undecaprenyl-phosphate GlcNAc-1-phosphate transferase